MRETLLLAVLVCACGAEADEVIVEEPEAPAAVQPETRPATPLCEGSPPASPALCQSLRYGDRGYCNFWVECSTLH